MDVIAVVPDSYELEIQFVAASRDSALERLKQDTPGVERWYEMVEEHGDWVVRALLKERQMLNGHELPVILRWQLQTVAYVA